MNTNKSTQPATVLEDDTIYLAFDRFVCNSPSCAGFTAVTTGRTIDGHKLSKLTPKDLRDWEAMVPGLPLQCECGAYEASFIQGIATVLPTD